MAAVLTAATPAAERGAVLTVAIVDLDDPALRVQIPHDATLTGELVDEYGITHAAAVAIADDDRAASLVPTATLPAGRYLAAVTVNAEDLIDAATVHASIDVAPLPFAAQLEDAAGLIVKTPLTATTNPSIGEARGYVADIAARVDVRLARRAELSSALELARIDDAARGLVALGAAALIADAMHPDRAASQGERRYGEVLWQRFTEGLDALAEDLGARLAADGAIAAGGRVAASFPPPSGIGTAGL